MKAQVPEIRSHFSYKRLTDDLVELFIVFVVSAVGSGQGLTAAPMVAGATRSPSFQAKGHTDPVSSEPRIGDLEQALTQGQTEKARDLVVRILERPRLNADILLRVGIQLAQHELYAEASQAFARCVKDYPERFEGYYNLALADYALGRFPDALVALRQAPHGSKEEEFGRSYLRGKIQEALGDLSDAERDLAAAFSGNPQEENYALDLGLFYLRQRAYQRAVPIFERGTAFNSRSPFLWLGLALAQFLGGQAAESIETSQKLIDLQPDFPPARLLMAFALYLGGKFPEAEKVAAAGLAAAHPYPFLNYLHAAVLLKLQSKEYERMLNELDLANRAIPGCSLCYLAASKVHQAMGRPEAAIADLEKAVELDRGFSEAWYHLASFYDRVGRHADAVKARERFRELKAEKSSRETELVRSLFLQTLGGQEQPPAPH